MKNANRVAIVTGASRCIGESLVAGYRRLGFDVAATSRSLAASKDEHVLAIAGDIRDRATAQKVVAAAKERLGRVDTPTFGLSPSRPGSPDQGRSERARDTGIRSADPVLERPAS